MASRSSATRSTASTTSNVRRNLFHHHLSRRPNSVSTSTTATTLQEQDYDVEIVTRDRNGNYEVSMPSLPSLDEDQAQDEEVREQESMCYVWNWIWKWLTRIENNAELIERYRSKKLEPYEQAGKFQICRCYVEQTLTRSQSC